MLVKGNHKIIFLFLGLGCVFHANAQQASISMPAAYSLKDSLKLPEISKKNLYISTRLAETVPFGYLPKRPVDANYFTRHWGIFCEGEWRLEKKTGLPLRFRLGSLEYVDRLEGK
ncbi:hypothetical protein [Flavihumibacter fluvii]|uniref:hypothetical protein n=1 Tax=Flavihumibacter fluvii TaxID=2838157 RepID=UPI001BDE6922|nr:hypothetical protein [Flavihumibacter fluvii]ULQ52228.1 hypothetical protein KJS93_19245 [Flavihumibacter fluvii]